LRVMHGSPPKRGKNSDEHEVAHKGEKKGISVISHGRFPP